ncbi:MAG: hypothetical protein ACRC9L_09640 [Brevinema sp.]
MRNTFFSFVVAVILANISFAQEQSKVQQNDSSFQVRPLQETELLVRKQQAKRGQNARRKAPAQSKFLKHRWSISLAFVEQNGPFREFSLLQDNVWYAVQFPLWGVNNISFGFSVGGAYDYTFNNRMMIRFQYGIESAGWITGFIDMGLGVRLPLSKSVNLTVEGYFSVIQTGGVLGRIGDFVPDTQDEFSLYLAVFGLKSRFSLEFALNKNYFIAPYISYVTYPWAVGTIENVNINGFRQGFLLDSLNIGIEFGKRF